MKIAVTGATGFVGRHVLAALAPHPVQVLGVTRDADKLAGSTPAVQVVQMDLSLPQADAFEKTGRPDVLIHLAWDGLPNYQSPHHFETELPRHYRFLKSMVEGGLPSLLVTGTCFEYGMQSGPLSEELQTRPGNSYGFAKDALRRQLELLRPARPFEFTWTRLFYMFGDGQPASSIYPQLREAAARNDALFGMSGGEQLRDYLPVEDVARQIVGLALARQGGGIFNVCSGRPVSVRRLVEQWIAQNGWHIGLDLGRFPYPAHEPMAFWGDDTKTRRALGTLP